MPYTIRSRRRLRLLTAVVAALAAGHAAAQVHDQPAAAQERALAAPVTTAQARMNRSALDAQPSFERFIVYYRDGGNGSVALPAGARSAAVADGQARSARLQALASDLARVSAALGLRVAHLRGLATGGELVGAPGARMNRAQALAFMQQLLANPAVAYVEPDRRMTIKMVPNDTYWQYQWDYSEATAGMNLPAAWDIANGSGVVVAVLDTGIAVHSDLSGQSVGGYDFITDTATARDGNGRDGSPNDEGDWFAAGECGVNYASDSSWHGTHVAGTIAALANNAKGIAGVAFGAKVLPVRVLGKCGGSVSDIADAIVWASGGSVSGVPANANPARVINMSLGGGGACGVTFQSAIDSARARGTTVVVAAGNENQNVSNSSPANCAGVVSVAALDRQGNRASYSNYGTTVDVAAPGGETAASAYDGILSTLNAGTTTQAAENYVFYQGTSMATPHVAGLVALMLSKSPSLSPDQVESSLKANVRSIPGSCSGGCGAGLVDAGKTLAALAGGGGGTPPTGTVFSNGTDLAIPDLKTVTSNLTVSGIAGNAPSALKVYVRIVHSFRGDLQLDLVAPSGKSFRLKNASSSDSAANVDATWTVNAATLAANGAWKLKITDKYRGDTGYLDQWSLTF